MAGGLEVVQDLAVGVLEPEARVATGVISELAVEAHGAVHREAVLSAHAVVVFAERWRHVHDAGARIEGHVRVHANGPVDAPVRLGVRARAGEVEQRLVLQAFELGPTESGDGL